MAGCTVYAGWPNNNWVGVGGSGIGGSLEDWCPKGHLTS